MTELYLEILFPKRIKPSDVLYTAKATRTKPGALRLKRAVIAPQSSGSPLAVVSWTGAKIGIAVPADQILPPYKETYRIEPAAEVGEGESGR
jgi:hypothetical protein